LFTETVQIVQKLLHVRVIYVFLRAVYVLLRVVASGLRLLRVIYESSTEKSIRGHS